MVDDEKMILRLATEALESYGEGFNVITALNGKQAVQILARSSSHGLGLLQRHHLAFCTARHGAAYMGLQVLEREKAVFGGKADFQPDFSGNSPLYPDTFFLRDGCQYCI